MCWEDEEIARKKGANEQRETVGGTVVPIIPASPQRTAILFLGASAGTISVSTREDVSTLVGLNVTATNGPHEIVNEKYGNAPTKAWFAVADAADRVLSWIEVTLPLEKSHHA